MGSPSPSNTTASTASLPDCVELGEWTPVPLTAPASLRLSLKDVDPHRAHQIEGDQRLTFHAVGCTGCHADQQATTRVAEVMAQQVQQPQQFGGGAEAVAPAFLYHLGDVIYKHDKDRVGDQSPEPAKTDFGEFYDAQFYRPYDGYTPPVFALAGNHDGKNQHPESTRKSAIHHFLKNFCGRFRDEPTDDQSSHRAPVAQPYPYWVLHTPVADFIGLYSNVNNGGQLDDPQADQQPQYEWLVDALKEHKQAGDGRALVLAVHYPPYSAAVNFAERGNPNLGPTPRPSGKTLKPLGVLLQQAFQESGQHPDVVLSAHAHLYQRLTYTCADGRQIPYLIAGAGGHIPVEKLAKPCSKTAAGDETANPRVVVPSWLALPVGDRVEPAHVNDQEFGFLRITIDGKKRLLTGEYFTAGRVPYDPAVHPERVDAFVLDWANHRLV